MNCEFYKDYVICGFRGGKIPEGHEEWIRKVDELKQRVLEEEEKRLKKEHRDECKRGWR